MKLKNVTNQRLNPPQPSTLNATDYGRDNIKPPKLPAPGPDQDRSAIKVEMDTYVRLDASKYDQRAGLHFFANG
jgi:hypothetical protein